jgi:hypothetical protein
MLTPTRGGRAGSRMVACSPRRQTQPSPLRTHSMKPSIKIAALLSALLVAIALSVGGCIGGDEDDNVEDVLQQTFSGEKKVDSGRIRVDVTARLEGLPGTVSILLQGPFAELERSIAETGQIPEAQLDMRVSGGGQRFDAGATSTGTRVYVKFRGKHYVLPQRSFNQLREQLERAQARPDRRQPDLAALGIDPSRWLDDSKHEGTEEIGGTAAAAADPPRHSRVGEGRRRGLGEGSEARLLHG